jgi:hypothetical protein
MKSGLAHAFRREKRTEQTHDEDHRREQREDLGHILDEEVDGLGQSRIR